MTQAEAASLSLSRAFARAAAAVDLVRFGPEPVARLKTCLIDFIGCACESFDLAESRQARAILPETAAGAPVIGWDRLAPPGDAAFANGVAGHGLVREDMHPGAIAHLGVVVWPVLLELAAGRRISGETFLKAALCGYEGGARLGRALFDNGLARLCRPTGIVGPPAGALAGAILLNLTEDEAVTALALAANCSSGLNEWPASGASDMYFHPGCAARSAVQSALLASAGAVGAERALDGPAGLFAAFRRALPERPVQLFADGEAEILAVYNKPAPACNFAQTACQTALAVAGRVINPAEIAGIAIDLPEAAIRYPGCDHAGPFHRPLQAKMSIQFSVAATLARGRMAEENYASLDDAVILRLARLTTLRRSEALTAAFPASQGAAIEVFLSNGERISHGLDDVVPATPDEVRERFRRAASARLGAKAAREIEALIDICETLEDAGRIAQLCRAK